MTNQKRTIKDYAVQILRSLLDSKSDEAGEAQPNAKDLSLGDVKEEHLRQERIRLDLEEQKLHNKLDGVLAQQRKVFEEARSNPNPSPNADQASARRFAELATEAQNLQATMEIISKRKRIINGLIAIKERERHLQSGLFEQIPLVSLIPQIEEATVKGEIGEEELNQVLSTLEHNFSPKVATIRTSEEEAFLQALNSAREAADQADVEQAYTAIKNAGLEAEYEPREVEA